MAPPAEAASPAAVLKALAGGAAMVAALMAAGIVLRVAGPATLRHVHPDAAGVAVVVLAGGLMTAAGLPRQVLAFSAGFVFGAKLGFAWAMLGQMLGCALDFFAARSVIGAWASRRIAGRWRQLDRFILRQPFTATLTLRLLPVGNNMLLNLLAGVAAVPPQPFLAATFIGYVPQTLIFVLLGSGLQLGATAQMAAGAALFVASAALGALLWRRGAGSALN